MSTGKERGSQDRITLVTLSTQSNSDKNLARKWAYKGVCDAIAGEDIGAKLKGSDWTEKKYQDRKDTEAEDEE